MERRPLEGERKGMPAQGTAHGMAHGMARRQEQAWWARGPARRVAWRPPGKTAGETGRGSHGWSSPRATGHHSRALSWPLRQALGGGVRRVGWERGKHAGDALPGLMLPLPSHPPFIPSRPSGVPSPAHRLSWFGCQLCLSPDWTGSESPCTCHGFPRSTGHPPALQGCGCGPRGTCL